MCVCTFATHYRQVGKYTDREREGERERDRDRDRQTDRQRRRNVIE